MRRAPVVCVLAGLLSACSPEAPVDLIVELRTDLVPGVEFSGVRARLEDGRQGDAPAFRGQAFERGERVAEFQELTRGDRDLEVSLLGMDGDVVVRRRVRVQHQRDLALVVLITRDCSSTRLADAPACPGAGDAPGLTECVGGRCGGTECIDGTGPSCPSPECAADSDCGAATACSRGQCVEGSCFFSERMDACGPDEYCALEDDSPPLVPDDGCTPYPDVADGGVPDAGAADSGAPDAGAADAGPMDGGFCAEDPCRLVRPQCGCAPGTVCQRPGGDTPLRECLPPGASALGESCMTNAECGEALVCVAVGGTVGHCTPFCAPGDSNCGTGTCAELFVTAEPVGACTSECNLATGAGCDPAFGCRHARVRDLTTTDIVDATICGEDGGPAEGEACAATPCRPRLICNDSSTCSPACEVTGPACTTGTCTALSPSVTIAGVEYGACI